MDSVAKDADILAVHNSGTNFFDRVFNRQK